MDLRLFIVETHIELGRLLGVLLGWQRPLHGESNVLRTGRLPHGLRHVCVAAEHVDRFVSGRYVRDVDGLDTVMGALDDLVAGPPPSAKRRPDEATMQKIVAARELGHSYRRIAEALGKDGNPTHPETVARWIREHA